MLAILLVGGQAARAGGPLLRERDAVL